MEINVPTRSHLEIKIPTRKKLKMGGFGSTSVASVVYFDTASELPQIMHICEGSCYQCCCCHRPTHSSNRIRMCISHQIILVQLSLFLWVCLLLADCHCHKVGLPKHTSSKLLKKIHLLSYVVDVISLYARSLTKGFTELLRCDFLLCRVNEHNRYKSPVDAR